MTQVVAAKGRADNCRKLKSLCRERLQLPKIWFLVGRWVRGCTSHTGATPQPQGISMSISGAGKLINLGKKKADLIPGNKKKIGYSNTSERGSV